MAYFKPGTDIPMYGNPDKKEHTESFVWAGEKTKSYFTEVTKAFAEFSGSDEIVTFNPPETHGSEPLHSQINLINKKDKHAFKIKFAE